MLSETESNNAVPGWRKALNSLCAWGVVSMLGVMFFAGFQLAWAGIYAVSLLGICIPVAMQTHGVLSFVGQVFLSIFDGVMFVFEWIGEVFA